MQLDEDYNEEYNEEDDHEEEEEMEYNINVDTAGLKYESDVESSQRERIGLLSLFKIPLFVFITNGS